MENPIMNDAFEQYRAEITSLLDDLNALVLETDDAQLATLINDIRSNVNEPFLFVVVGEIKAGKSSFINALVGVPICQVDPAPCTDVIQQLVYSPEKTQVEINPHHRRIGLPESVLKHIAIVDTPGTNTVIEHHHEITERYIPNSGLVLFVFPAKNPHTRTAWELLDYISEEWRKQVIFILQQADLATSEELQVNTEKVWEYATGHGIDTPRIFSTSAKWEAENDPRSGFDAIRSHIRTTVTGGRHLFLKLSGVLATGEKVLKKIHDALQRLKDQLGADRQAARSLENQLNNGTESLRRESQNAVERFVAKYDRIGFEIKAEFDEGLSVPKLYKRAVGAMFSKKQSLKKWIESLQAKFEDRLNTVLDDMASEMAHYFTDAVRNLADNILKTLQNTASGANATAPTVVDVFEKREAVVADLREKIKALAATDLFFTTQA
ncbi:MAG: dynamin family protein, partial [Deltaproteobacteria bacterium]|nr:dynamin family protein [Deltaproteobacteria bacterium]